MLISLIITTKNEEKNIASCLTSILQQRLSGKTLEVIVVDNFSSDRTVEIAKKMGAKVYRHGPERNSQRNYGLLRKAKGSILVWIDADMILHPDLIEGAVNILVETSGAVGITMPEIILGNDMFTNIRRFERSFYNGTVIDGARIIRAEALKKVGGFSTNWEHGPDDWDLDLKLKKLGAIIHFEEECQDAAFQKYINENFPSRIKRFFVGIYHNESNLGLANHLRKKLHYASDFNGYLDKWKGEPALRLQLGVYYRFFGVFFEEGKWRRVVRSPHLYIGFFAIKATVGMIYIVNKHFRFSLIR